MCDSCVIRSFFEVNVEFTYNGVSLNKAAEDVGLLQLDMFLGQERTRVVPDGVFLSRGLQYSIWFPVLTPCLVCSHSMAKSNTLERVS